MFVWMVAAGALIALWYGLLAALRRLLAAGLWLSLAADLAFGAGAAAIFCGALVAANYGRLRLYAVLAALLGFGLCASALFSPVRRAAAAFARAVRRILVKISGFRWIKVIFR